MSQQTDLNGINNYKKSTLINIHIPPYNENFHLQWFSNPFFLNIRNEAFVNAKKIFHNIRNTLPVTEMSKLIIS